MQKYLQATIITSNPIANPKLPRVAARHCRTCHPLHWNKLAASLSRTGEVHTKLGSSPGAQTSWILVTKPLNLSVIIKALPPETAIAEFLHLAAITSKNRTRTSNV